MTKEMSAGMMETIVFSINMREGAPKEALSFPPKGFNVIRTI